MREQLKQRRRWLGKELKATSRNAAQEAIVNIENLLRRPLEPESGIDEKILVDFLRDASRVLGEQTGYEHTATILPFKRPAGTSGQKRVSD